ncbi:hypothetical protein [Treponema sp. C6A8]|uniref:hypothetical protein n=1 Tax=Treponema sp. C6A8 TaxID=1410609 RepID=UPI00047F3CA7|nr:hypothetical protein [Treponema sp. C6A8]
MKKTAKKCELIVKVLIGLALLPATSCSSLFDDFMNVDGSLKTGDTSLSLSSFSSRGRKSSSSSEQNSSGGSVINSNPEAFYSSDDEVKNTETTSGIVVLKATEGNYNQIFYNAAQHEYEVGYDKSADCTDAQKAARNHSSSVFLCAKDDPVTVKAFKNNSNAKITYSAVQTRTTNIANGIFSSDSITENMEVFVDLPEASQMPVEFSVAEGNGDPIVFSNLPYGTTCVKITIIADDDYYSDSYIVYLNKKHILTSLSEAEEGNSEKTDLTTGLVVLKESDGFNKNQISYEPSVKDYKTANLTSKDNTVYLKAVPSDENATVSWSASYTAKPVYKYEYYQTVTKTVVKVDANGKLIKGPETTKETKKVASYVENTTSVEEHTDSDGSTTTTTTSTVTRETVTGLEKMEEIEEKDISSILLPVENQNSDRVRITSLPYGVTKVTATVLAYDKTNPITNVYTITLPRVQYYSTSQDFLNDIGGSSASPVCEDDTSKLEDLSVTNLVTIDDEGNKTNQETQAITNFTFNKDETIYSLVVSENTDVIILNPKLSENETMSNPVSKTKYSELKSNNYSVNLLGGLQVITFTVTEEGCQPRTYTIYAYKQSGNTILEAINYSSLDSKSGTWTAHYMDKDTGAKANYKAGVTAMFPAKVALTNGGEKNKPNNYSLYVRADNACDVTKMEFSVKPYDSHTHIYYYVGDTCPEEDSTKWGTGYLRADNTNRIIFDLSNKDSSALTTLWLKTVSRPYYHSDDFDTSKNVRAEDVSTRSDVSYHKIVISKPGDSNTAVKELIIETINENNKQNGYYSYLDTDDDAGVRHIVENVPKTVTTDTDVAKIYFRMADDDASACKKISYKVQNIRASSTNSTANESFSMNPTKETTLAHTYKEINGKKYYEIILGEIQTENANDVANGRTTKDLPMGKTEITILVGEKESSKITFNKPDLDCHTLTAKPAIDKGSSYGVYVSDFDDVIYYLNAQTDKVLLTMNTSQKNETISVVSYNKMAGENESIEADVILEPYDINGIVITKPSELPYTSWTSEVKNIPVGTSQVIYKVTSAVGEPYSKNYKVTFVRAGDTETRLQTYNVRGPNKAITGFKWDDVGTEKTGVSEGKEYVNKFELTDGTGEYTIEALPINDNEIVQAFVYRNDKKDVTEASPVEIELKEVTSTDGTKTKNGTFDVETDYNYIIVRVKVTNKTNTNYIRYYDTIITVDLETTTGITAVGKQYYNKEKNNSDSLQLSTSKTAATNINSNGDIQIDVSKSEKASWNSDYPKVYVESADITGDKDVNVDSNKNITIPYSVYSQYSGKTIKVIYSATAELSSVVETKEYLIEISDFTKVTDYTSWTRSDTRSYVRPSSVTNAKQLAFRFASMINEVNTNWIYTATDKGSKTGGVDIVGSLDGGKNWGATSYNFSGLHYLVQQGNSLYLAKLEESSGNTTKAEKFYLLDVSEKTAAEKSADDLGISLSVTAEVCYDGDTPYLLLKADVSGADKLGVIMDTLVAPETNATKPDADKVKINPSNNGFTMAGSGYCFNVFLKNALGVDDVSRFWYGSYTGTGPNLGYLNSVFTDTNSESDAGDSAISFSWDLLSREQTSRSFRVTISEE